MCLTVAPLHTLSPQVRGRGLTSGGTRWWEACAANRRIFVTSESIGERAHLLCLQDYSNKASRFSYHVTVTQFTLPENRPLPIRMACLLPPPGPLLSCYLIKKAPPDTTALHSSCHHTRCCPWTAVFIQILTWMLYTALSRALSRADLVRVRTLLYGHCVP